MAISVTNVLSVVDEDGLLKSPLGDEVIVIKSAKRCSSLLSRIVEIEVTDGMCYRVRGTDLLAAVQNAINNG